MTIRDKKLAYNGYCVVIVSRFLYLSNIYEFVNGTPKFKRLSHDPKIQSEGSFQR